MQNLSKRDKNLLVIMLVFILAAVLLNLVPSGSKTTNRNLLPLDEARSKTTKAKIAYKEMLADQERLEPDIKRKTFTMPPEQLTAYVTEDLYALAARAGVHIRETKPLKSKTLSDGVITRVPLEVRIRAPFQPNVMRFLYYVEEPDKNMVVEKVNITSSDTNAKTVDVAAQITVFTRSAENTTPGKAQGETNDNTNTTNHG